MAKQTVVVDSVKGVESVQTIVSSVGDAVAAGELASRTALSLRLLHENAKAADLAGIAVPVNYIDSITGTFEFRCACGRTFRGPWEEARWESVAHVERHHASASIKRDLDILEDVIEVLIVPSPLYDWDELQNDNN
jgi:hypothetical protein